MGVVPPTSNFPGRVEVEEMKRAQMKEPSNKELKQALQKLPMDLRIRIFLDVLEEYAKTNQAAVKVVLVPE